MKFWFNMTTDFPHIYLFAVTKTFFFASGCLGYPLTGCKESQFYSPLFGQAVASMY